MIAGGAVFPPPIRFGSWSGDGDWTPTTDVRGRAPRDYGPRSQPHCKSSTINEHMCSPFGPCQVAVLQERLFLRSIMSGHRHQAAGRGHSMLRLGMCGIMAEAEGNTP